MLDKNFDPTAFESRLYETWEQAGAFAATPTRNARPFTIMIPPPNVTGSLHVGHALTMTLQDVLIRYQRMQGRDALWQPGTDHAGIATQLMVERELQREGTSRQEIGREAFLDRVWQWKAAQGGTITKQLRRLGASPDWSRERFTMDEGLSRAVRTIFVRLFNDGLIYRAKRLVNWDPEFASAISDLEVEMREVKGHLWHLRYPIEGSDLSIVVATTRPETMLGDTAVAVHPTDERFRDLIGKTIIQPITGRRIPIIADEYSDPEKGSGAVKITPAHDFNDFAVGQRHQLASPSIFDRAARVVLAEIRADAQPPDPDFFDSLEGLDRFAARAEIVAHLEAAGALVLVESHTHTVPHADRSNAVIEPLLTEQWFCNAEALAKPAIAAVEDGRVAFVPKSWENTYFAWMRNIEPWCISRQLWWGHRIPAWYGPDCTIFVAETEADAALQAEEHYGHPARLRQDDDVLDTWFSSALWPFSTLGWPDNTRDLTRYYPGDVLVTGFDIIFFWVARMIMMGLYVMGDVPFRTVLMNGLVRDERGQKMSKTKGNVVDPLALIEAYGADALRYTVTAQSGAGRNIKLGAGLVEANRSFITKIWNAARFCEMNQCRPDPAFNPAAATLPLSRWILDAANRTITEASEALDAYRLSDYALICYRFTWGDFCDWFLELAKPSLISAPGLVSVDRAGNTDDARELRAVTAHVLGILLRLLHPVIPFVTETLWDEFGYGAAGSLIRTPWPERSIVTDADAARAEVSWVIRAISEIRAVRNEMNVPAATRIPLLIRDASAETLARAQRWREEVARLARVSSLEPLHGEMPHGAAQAILDEATLILPLADIIDLAAERQRLANTRAKTASEAEKIARKLENQDFVSRAPEDIIAENRDRLDAAQAELARLDAALSRIA
ncbi:MAG: valine--tRNA ligase [Acidiphilium sp.]|nr:valine--tRNA ligase [Acidiphilium sp.]MDD4934701.1 valine--tRNA ligase [Acidiphilium sp.]